MKELTRGQIDRLMANLFATVSFDGPVEPSDDEDEEDPLVEAFDAALHPRASAGAPTGGQFVAREQQTGDSPNELPGVPGSRRADPVSRLAFTRMRNFLLRRGFLVPSLDLYVATSAQLQAIGAPGTGSATAVDGGIVIAADLVAMTRAIEKGARLRSKLMNVDQFSPDMAKVLIHEMLHHTRGVAAYNAAHHSKEELDLWLAQRSTEEAIVEAVSVDETMAWVKRFPWRSGMSVGVAEDYRDGVSHIRKLSEKVTGKNWTSPEAQVWRRSLLMADMATRSEMIATAGGIP